MGRRQRRRTTQRDGAPAGPRARDHQARVKVTEEVWREFRLVAGERSVASVLGELVTRAVERERARRVHDGQVEDGELLAALERARELQDDLTAIVGRLERRVDRGTRLFD